MDIVLDDLLVRVELVFGGASLGSELLGKQDLTDEDLRMMGVERGIREVVEEGRHCSLNSNLKNYI